MDRDELTKGERDRWLYLIMRLMLMYKAGWLHRIPPPPPPSLLHSLINLRRKEMKTDLQSRLVDTARGGQTKLVRRWGLRMTLTLTVGKPRIPPGLTRNVKTQHGTQGRAHSAVCRYFLKFEELSNGFIEQTDIWYVDGLQSGEEHTQLSLSLSLSLSSRVQSNFLSCGAQNQFRPDLSAASRLVKVSATSRITRKITDNNIQSRKMDSSQRFFFRKYDLAYLQKWPHRWIFKDPPQSTDPLQFPDGNEI